MPSQPDTAPVPRHRERNGLFGLPAWSPVDFAVGPLAVVPTRASLQVEGALDFESDVEGPDERPAVSFGAGASGDPVREDLKPGAGAWPRVDRTAKGDLDLDSLPEDLGILPDRPDLAEDGAVPLSVTGSPLGGTSPATDNPGLAALDSRTTQRPDAPAIERPVELPAGPVAVQPAPAPDQEALLHWNRSALASISLPTSNWADQRALPPLPERPSEPAQETPDYSRPGPVPLAAQDFEHAKECLARAVYFESRSESSEGQVAVAQVVLNRLRSPYYPKAICDVVYQGANGQRWGGCQFSFACTGMSRAITDRRSWRQAQAVAQRALDGEDWLPDVGNATHYHATYVHPRWVRDMVRQDRIGRHIFYRVKWWAQAAADGALGRNARLTVYENASAI